MGIFFVLRVVFEDVGSFVVSFRLWEGGVSIGSILVDFNGYRLGRVDIFLYREFGGRVAEVILS